MCNIKKKDKPLSSGFQIPMQELTAKVIFVLNAHARTARDSTAAVKSYMQRDTSILFGR